MTTEPSRREITSAQFLAVGAGGALAGVLFLVTGYMGMGLLLLVVGAAISWFAWRYRSGGAST